MTPQASTLVSFGIPTIAVLVLTLESLIIWRYVGPGAARRFALGSALWLAYSALLGATGFLTDFEAVPPRLLALVLPTVALPVLLALSPLGARLASETPLAVLIGLQAFRVPLELVMHQAAVEGTMPPQMTYTGSNFDIVTGLTAAGVAGLCARGRAPRWLLVAWNALGSALLLAILVIAVASMPMFRAFGSEPELVNTWVGFFPFVWLPAGPVTAALFGHLLVWRRLLSHGMRGRALSALS
jgi:hypothetical protein